MANITIFRLSFLWVETIPAIVARDLPLDAPFSFLSQQGDYVKRFSYLRTNPPPPIELSIPWEKPTGQRFWKFYFEGKQAGEVTGIQAWKKFVPFRKPFVCEQIMPMNSGETTKVTFEVFYAPQGVALVANVNYRGEGKSLMEIATLAHHVRSSFRFSIDGLTTKGGLSLDAIGEQALAKVRREHFGAVEGFPGHNQPFSIASFISGTDIERDQVIRQGSEEHRVLEAITGWNRYFPELDLATTPLADAKLPIHKVLPSDILYARKSARAIWLPRSINCKSSTTTQTAGISSSPMSNTSLISCYHRNLLLATMLTLSMGEFVAWVAAQHSEGKAVREIHNERAKRMVSLLQMLSDGKNSTYRTASIAQLIQDAEWPQQMALIRSV